MFKSAENMFKSAENMFKSAENMFKSAKLNKSASCRANRELDS